jgi:hypothetical protein
MYISVWIIITGLADVKLVPVINYPPRLEADCIDFFVKPEIYYCTVSRPY